MMNLLNVIDAHTHAFPEAFISEREALVTADRWFGHLYGDPKAKLTSEVELLQSMDACGVRYSIIAGFPWKDAGRCREHNAWMADVCRKHPDRLGYLGIVNPNDSRASADAEYAFGSGALGVGELNADAQDFDLEEPDSTGELMEVSDAWEKPVMIHASEPVGHEYFGKGTATPAKLMRWIEEYQHQQIVLAHWGGGLPFYELMPEIEALTRNVSYDTAATTYLYRFEVFDAVASIAGAGRILFGSDFPVLGQKRLLKKVNDILPDEDVRERVLSANAARVYQIEALA